MLGNVWQHERMTRLQKASAWGWLLGLCACGSPDIAILDLTTGQMVHPPYSGMRQVLVAVDRTAGTFTTLARQEDRFRVRTLDAAGRTVDETTIPLFTESYAGATHYALSRDGRRLVYLKDGTSNLYLFDLPTARETLLWAGITTSAMEFPRLEWLAASKVLVVLREHSGSTRKANEVTVLDIATGDRQVIYRPVYPSSFDYSLSPDASLFAFRDGNSREDVHGVLKILSLQTGRLRATLGGGLQVSGLPVWSPDGAELGFVEGRDLKVWTLADGQVRILRTFPEGFICYRLVFGQGIIGYVGGSPNSAQTPLVTLDSRTGTERGRVQAAFNGRLLLLDGNHTVVCEIGF